MKKIVYILAVKLYFLALPVHAGLAVVDVSLISTNIQNATRRLIEDGIRDLNQQALIDQSQSYLNRLGDPSKVNYELVKDVLAFLEELGVSMNAEDVIRDLDEEEIFNQVPGSVYQPVQREIIIDGEVEGEIDTKAFTGEVAMLRSISRSRTAHFETLKSRKMLNQKLQQALVKLQDAKTDSEVQKLIVTVEALSAQLGAIDRDSDLASNEMMTRWIELQLEERTRAKAQAQKDRISAQIAVDKNRKFYNLQLKPVPIPERL